jgi:hypothetical protein
MSTEENRLPKANYEPFLSRKPPHTLRIFAMGESTMAGFPYRGNPTFTRMIRAALDDVLPSDSVEVIDIGIPGTDSYALVDEADEVIAQHPDAVLIYSGHNEFYGALGVGSMRPLLGGSPALVRGFLRLQRLRTVMALRDGLAWLRGRLSPRRDDSQSAGLTETLVDKQEVPLGSAVYKRGERQFESNLSVLLDKFSAAHVPVFIGSQASNVRDRHPFWTDENGRAGGADSVYAEARSAWRAGDTANARALFVRARDLDDVRFRASSDLNRIIRSQAARHGAVYVPIAESISRAAVGGSPGYDLFLEHVHPNVQGIAIIARSYFEAIARRGFVGRTADVRALRGWDDYTRGMHLTDFDKRIARLTARAICTKWPFVPRDEQLDLRRGYRPRDFADTLALAVALGAAPWRSAKFALAQRYVRRGFADSAVAELRTAVLHAPAPQPWDMLADAFTRAGQPDSARQAARHARRLRGLTQ